MAMLPNQTFDRDTPGERIRFYLLIVSLLVICFFDRILVHHIQLDWLNITPLAATLYVGYCVIALEKTCGHISFFRRRLVGEPAVPKPMGSFLLSHLGSVLFVIGGCCSCSRVWSAMPQLSSLAPV